MGLKGYRLWDMGQLDSTCRSPPLAARSPLLAPMTQNAPIDIASSQFSTASNASLFVAGQVELYSKL
jgi:hypothetical protein